MHADFVRNRISAMRSEWLLSSPTACHQLNTWTTASERIVLKNSVLRRSENSKEFFNYLVRESQINCAVLSCVRAGFHAVLTTLAPLFKTEFFNSIGQDQTLKVEAICLS
jgi:hypothetical protein